MQTDRHVETVNRFSQCFERAKNATLSAEPSIRPTFTETLGDSLQTGLLSFLKYVHSVCVAAALQAQAVSTNCTCSCCSHDKNEGRIEMCCQRGAVLMWIALWQTTP